MNRVIDFSALCPPRSFAIYTQGEGATERHFSRASIQLDKKSKADEINKQKIKTVGKYVDSVVIIENSCRNKRKKKGSIAYQNYSHFRSRRLFRRKDKGSTRYRKTAGKSPRHLKQHATVVQQGPSPPPPPPSYIYVSV